MARNGLIGLKKLIDNAQKTLLPEQEFLNDLKRAIEQSSEKEKHKPSKYYKPSSMNCIRNMYYTRTGKKTTDSTSNYISCGICNSGTDTHVRVQTVVSQMQDMGIDCQWIDVATFIKQRKLKHLKVVSQSGMETKLRHTGLNMSFMCDGIIRYKGHYYILELKTESSNKWYSREGVDPSHYHQAIAYSLSFDLDEVLFVYINRDIFDLKAFMFKVTDDMKHELAGLIDQCEQYVGRLIPPPKPEDISRKTCEYCGFKTLCRKDG